MRDNNKQLTKQVLGLMGDTMMALIIGVLCLVALGGIVGAIWNLVA
jgi:hypothetical protein